MRRICWRRSRLLAGTAAIVKHWGCSFRCGAGRMLEMCRIENAIRFTKIKKNEGDWNVHVWKDLKDRGDDWSDNVER